MNTWIKIEDQLPEGNTPVLAFDGERVIRACWTPKFTDDNPNNEGDFYDYREEDDTYWVPEGWYELMIHWVDYYSVAVQSNVTHWMPLPDKPDGVK